MGYGLRTAERQTGNYMGIGNAFAYFYVNMTAAESTFGGGFFRSSAFSEKLAPCFVQNY